MADLESGVGLHVRPELLTVADAVARDKSIDRDEVLEAMEQAIQRAGRSKYGHEHDIRAHIDRTTGEITLARYIEVVADDAEIDPESEAAQLVLSEALKRKPDAEVGAFIVDPLPPIDFGRIAAQTAKQVIVQKVREAERKRQYAEYKDRIGEVVNGIVKRVEFGNVVVDMGRGEGLMRRDDTIPREHFNNGDRVRAYIKDVREEQRGPQIFLSRTAPEFMAKLFAQEVPEIYDGIIEIKAVARDPGSRAKLAVISNDSSIDPVGPCIGMRGSRVQAVVSELQGEKIDIIQWSADPAMFLVNALAPAEVAKVVLDEDNNKIEVVVPEDQLSLAIGRRGQNVRLASQLTGWDIDILTEDEESERRQEENRKRSQLFVDALDIDEVIAQLLLTEGFTSVDEVAFVPVDDLAEIEGFDMSVAEELRERARAYLAQREEDIARRLEELGISDEVKALEGFTPAMLVKLGDSGVKTLDDLGDLAGDELVEILAEDGIGETQANEIIMAARAHWFAEDGQSEGDATSA
ncbi:transcription termination factor NusA [Varunaivibrio sulfuroxidans]|uniref:Transcription termination/antitermination protein NusA n=1 Tax=Varunaivibrio sulfuroxidans TaxID=1773489 RepID=A0A4R3JGM9_9PROT|nr:transcription termination factor NusA [Varunaivibrio sulfuroxidans]TCS65057.1 NusA antitermination factor [Varunaivibrio sulfuroxidans]WES29656.1 transcription termination factor NusA [Varunaivibrio sulfuroxidans]